MEIFKQVKEFNVNKGITSYIKIIGEDKPKCKYCKGEIYYDNIRLRIDRNESLVILGNSYKTTKKHGHTLKVCEKCLSAKFGDYHLKNKSRVFNTSNDMTIYAFDLSKADIELYKTGVTKDKLFSKYGKNDGQKRWDSYLEKQSMTNTFEYKKEKYGWSQNDFNLFNKSRGVTKELLIKKYGKIDGVTKWASYLEKQSYTKSRGYMIKKFGKKRTEEINKSKGLTLSNFQRKYGNDLGFTKFDNYIKHHQSFFSNISQEFFKKLDESLKNKYHTYYAIKNGEFGVSTTVGYKKLDYYIKELNLCIEFNGDLFHANPLIFSALDCPNPFNTNLTAEEIWKNEQNRIETLWSEHNIKTIVVWESEYKKGIQINKFLETHGILF